jgi:hypothetical protein
MKSRKTIEFDLLNNAKDSLRQAIELIAFKDIGSDHSRLKHAITTSAHCIELLLKERLCRINPALVWENTKKSPSPQARTVTVGQAVSRLMSKGNVIISENDKQTLKTLRTTRNEIEHHEWHASEKEAKVILANALSFAFDFVHHELGVDLTSNFKTDCTWEVLLEELCEFASAHGARIEKRLTEKGVWLLHCDACGQLTVPVNSGSCELCGHCQPIDDDD